MIYLIYSSIHSPIHSSIPLIHSYYSFQVTWVVGVDRVVGVNQVDYVIRVGQVVGVDRVVGVDQIVWVDRVIRVDQGDWGRSGWLGSGR